MIRALRVVINILFLISLASPSWAGDPFRTESTRNIGENTQEAFDALFQQGNYLQAKRYLLVAELKEPNEPLVYAMRGAIAYLEKDLNTMKDYADKTVTAAQNMQSKDPTRGNLYLAVGNFLQGGYMYQKEGAVAALNKLQLVFQYLDEAEKATPNDPEVNLIKGYLELILAVNLPFSSPGQAIERLEKNASPDYLVYRGIALAYRDLDDYSQALKFVDRAIQITPDNPELYYLKGQILRKQGNKEKNLSLLSEASTSFDKALAKSDQLPESLLKPLRREKEKVQKEIDKLK